VHVCVCKGVQFLGFGFREYGPMARCFFVHCALIRLFAGEGCWVGLGASDWSIGEIWEWGVRCRTWVQLWL
jgi:hypothetical protein